MPEHPYRIEVVGSDGRSVDLTEHVVGLRVDVVPQAEPTRGLFGLLPLTIAGEATLELSADEWANLTEHLTISDEPGRI